MTLRLLCITEPSTHPPRDATVHLYSSIAQRPDVQFFHTPASEIGPTGVIRTCHVTPPLVSSYEAFLALKTALDTSAHITEFDLVYCRTDMPFPPGYYDHLARFEKDVQFVARPSSLNRGTSREFIDSVAGQYLIPHITTANPAAAIDFLNEHSLIVAKLDQSYGGKGVFKVYREGAKYVCEHGSGERQLSESAEPLFAALIAMQQKPIQLMRFVRNIAAGDKRVLVVEGEIVGAYLRRASGGKWVHNSTGGSESLPADILPREKEIVAATYPAFDALGLFLVGYDFLDDDGPALSEINCGNVGGMYHISQLGKPNIFNDHIDWFLRKAKAQGFRVPP